MNDKEKAEEEINGMSHMVGPAMRLMNELTKDIVSKNVMSKFVEENMGDLLGDDSEMASGFLVKAIMDESNKNPKKILERFLNFYNAFRVFYVDLMDEGNNGERSDTEQ